MKEYEFMSFLLRNTKNNKIIWDVYDHINNKFEDMIISTTVGDTRIELEPNRFFVYTVDTVSNKSRSYSYRYDEDTLKIKNEIFDYAFKDYIPFKNKTLEWACDNIKSIIEKK